MANDFYIRYENGYNAHNEKVAVGAGGSIAPFKSNITVVGY